MNTAAARAASGIWSVACLSVTFGLLGLFVYWVCIQQPPRLVVDQAMPVHHPVSAGSIVYFEAPILSAGGASWATVEGQLTQEGKVRYFLASPDSVPEEVRRSGSETFIGGPTAYPMYALYIPSYVRPGSYEYRAAVTYRLNPFRTRTAVLPTINITVQ